MTRPRWLSVLLRPDSGQWMRAFAHPCSVKALWIPAFAGMTVVAATTIMSMASFPLPRRAHDLCNYLYCWEYY